MAKSTEQRLKDLEDFKTKVEMGSWWLKCICYTVGAVIVAVSGAITIIKDWPFK